MIKRVSHTNLTFPRVLTCLILLGISINVSAGKLYKWIDENGEVRYSDRIPPNQVKREHQTLNAQGIVIATKQAAKTEDELKAIKEAARELQAKQEVERQNKEAQGKVDRVLLLTFSSEKEMKRVKNDRIEVLDSVIRLIYKSIATTEERLNRFEDIAEQQYISQEKEVPGGLAQNIEESSRKLKNREKQLSLKLGEKYKIEAQYEIDVARFRLLSSQ
jgi:hypothetical protein